MDLHLRKWFCFGEVFYYVVTCSLKKSLMYQSTIPSEKEDHVQLFGISGQFTHNC